VRRSPVCCGPGTRARTPLLTRSLSARTRIERIPQQHIEAIEILLRVDSAGATHELIDWCREGNLRFSVGYDLTEPVRAAIQSLPENAWVAALDQDGSQRPNGQVAELTGRVDLTSWPERSRLIVRRERAHPGAQLSFTDHDGHRFQVFLTDQPEPDIAILERRQRQRARVEDHIRNDKDTGLRKLPFRDFNIEPDLARAGADRARPDPLDPGAAALGRARQSRTKTPALPPPARRGQARGPRPASAPSHPTHLAMGDRTRRRVREAASAPIPRRLTRRLAHTTTSSNQRRPRSPLPANRPAHHDHSPAKQSNTRPALTRRPRTHAFTQKTPKRSPQPRYCTIRAHMDEVLSRGSVDCFRVCGLVGGHGGVGGSRGATS